VLIRLEHRAAEYFGGDSCEGNIGHERFSAENETGLARFDLYGYPSPHL